MKICGHCGAEMPEEARFCTRCGNPFTTPEEGISNRTPAGDGGSGYGEDRAAAGAGAYGSGYGGDKAAGGAGFGPGSMPGGSGYGGAGAYPPPPVYGRPVTPFSERPLDPQIVADKLKSLRHGAELPLFGVMIGVQGLVLLIIFIRAIVGAGLSGGGMNSFFRGDPVTALVFTVIGWMTGILGIAYMVINLLLAYYMLYAETISGAVLVTPVNFPEIYAKSVEYTRLLSLEWQPEVYIMQSNGVLNAFSAWMLKKRYVVLNAELVDIAYMEHKDFRSVYFVMAHEFGHHYFNHTALWRNLLIMYAQSFFPVAMAFSRACEYSCDRVAQVLTQEDGTDAMMMLTAGRHLYKYVDPGDYLGQLLDRPRQDARVFRWIYNFLSSHPIMPFRVQALVDPVYRSGRVV